MNRIIIRNYIWIIIGSILCITCQRTASFRKEINKASVQPVYWQLYGNLYYEHAQLKYPLKIVCKIQKDCIIWFSIRAKMGIEVMRGKFTPDSIALINRWHRTYYQYSYEQLDSLMNISVNYALVQEVLLGYVDTLGKKTRVHTNLHDHTVIQQQYKKCAIERMFLIGSKKQLRRITIHELLTGRCVVMNYQKYYSLGKHMQQLALQQKLSYYSKDPTVASIIIQVKYSKVKVSTIPISFLFAKPKNYEKK